MVSDAHNGGVGLPALWFGVLAGPAAWVLQLNGGYFLVSYDCRAGLPHALYRIRAPDVR